MTKSFESSQQDTARRLRKRPLGRYRYVRLRWRVLFAVIDFVGRASKATLYSPDLFEPVVLPVSNSAGRTAITVRPNLLKRYSIVLAHP